jgi:hypothetical protein
MTRLVDRAETGGTVLRPYADIIKPAPHVIS